MVINDGKSQRITNQFSQNYSNYIDINYTQPSLNFDLPEKQKLLRRSVRKFAEDILAPYASIIDRESIFNWETAKELAKINAWGIEIPEQYGGAELDPISYSIIIEEISRICASTGLTISTHNSLGAYPIYKWGTEEQKERFLYDIASGKKIAAFAWTETNAGSDAGGIQSIAIQDGDDFILNGSKIFITNGGIASTVVIGARCKKENGDEGLAAFIVEKDIDGYEIGSQEDKMGMRGSSTTFLYFKNMRIPKENLLGNFSDGFKIAMKTLEVGRIGIAAQSVGIAQAAYEKSVEYSKNRYQFNKPISSFQGISFKLAEMATNIDAARLLTYRASSMKDKGVIFTKESAMSKYYASKIAAEITQEAIQIHGGYGYMKDLPIERYFRDAKATEIYEGTSEIMKLIISQQILKGNL